MFDNNFIKIGAIALAVILVGYFLCRIYRKYKNNNKQNLPVNGYNAMEGEDGLAGVPEEKNEGIEKEYRTNEFAQNFLNDLDKSGVYNLQ